MGQWVVVDGQAARPKDLYILRGAGAQFMGRAGGEDVGGRGRLQQARSNFSGSASRSSWSGRLGGGWGVGTASPRDHVRFYIHNLESQSPF